MHDQNEKEGYHFSKILKILPAFEEFKRKLRSFGFQINLLGIEDDNKNQSIGSSYFRSIKVFWTKSRPIFN